MLFVLVQKLLQWNANSSRELRPNSRRERMIRDTESFLTTALVETPSRRPCRRPDSCVVLANRERAG
jgi:hypothetical protein